MKLELRLKDLVFLILVGTVLLLIPLWEWGQLQARASDAEQRVAFYQNMEQARVVLAQALRGQPAPIEQKGDGYAHLQAVRQAGYIHIWIDPQGELFTGGANIIFATLSRGQTDEDIGQAPSIILMRLPGEQNYRVTNVMLPEKWNPAPMPRLNRI